MELEERGFWGSKRARRQGRNRPPIRRVRDPGLRKRETSRRPVEPSGKVYERLETSMEGGAGVRVPLESGIGLFGD